MGDFYIGRQRVVIERDNLVSVWADDQQDAERKLAAGEGETYAYVAQKTLEQDPVREVQYDRNEGMGR